LNHAFRRSFFKLGSFGFIYINGSYIWKWDLILIVFNSKTVTSSDKCTWIIIIPEMQKLHVITFFLLSYINQGRPFFQLSSLENARNNYLTVWFEPTRAWTYDGPHLRWSCLPSHNWWGSNVCCIFFLNMFSEEPTSNNIQWYQVKSAPSHFDTYLNSQICTYSNRHLVISTPI
jgi:hypothetical protein